jgi:hypothetical protein
MTARGYHRKAETLYGSRRFVIDRCVWPSDVDHTGNKRVTFSHPARRVNRCDSTGMKAITNSTENGSRKAKIVLLRTTWREEN